MTRLKGYLAIGLLLIAAASSSTTPHQMAPIIVPDDFESIQQAIEASLEGGLIIVREGSYPEGLTITKSLTLRAEGKVILAGTISIKDAQRVRIEGFELRYSPVGIEVRNSSQVSLLNLTIEPSGLERPYAAVLVKDGGVRIERSSLSNGDKVISLTGQSKAEIVGNTITRGTIAGIFVADQSEASIVENAITQNLLAGVALADQAGASIKANSIGGNELDGIAVFPEAIAAIIGNSIQNNGGCGVWADPRARVRGWNNRISENKQGDLCGAASALQG